MNKLDKAYQDLLQDILDNGTTKNDRTGTGTISVFGRQIRHDMKSGFPLLTTKKIHFKSVVTELLWFLRGDTNIKWLLDNGCTIWNGDAYKNYQNKVKFSSNPYDFKIKDSGSLKLNGKEVEGWGQFQIDDEFSKEEFIEKIKTDDEFAKKWGELGPVYGKQWRSWGDGGYSTWTDVNDKVLHKHRTDYPQVDQIANLINDLKTNPDSRRLMVNAWNAGELDQMVLPPCHYSWQVYTKELSLDERLDLMRKRTRDGTVDYDNRHHVFLDYHDIPKRAISLMWNQRSVDLALGWPFNVASYGLLLELLGKMVNMVPDELVCNLGDVHLYNNHLEGAREQIIRTPYELPKLNINTEFWPTESGECGIGPIDALAVLRSFSDDNFCKCLMEEDIQLYNYQSHPKIHYPLSN
jgi:thymidylate synthase